MTRTADVVLFLASFLVASCATNPPKARLHYQVAGESTWRRGADGALEDTFLGASVRLDLQPQQSLLEVTVRNTTEVPIEFRVGPDGMSPQPPIGELLLRQFTPPSVTGPDVVAYICQSPVQVQPGWRAVFYLDAPFGRAPTVGQYLVFAVEARDAAGKRERRTVPLIAEVTGPTHPR